MTMDADHDRRTTGAMLAWLTHPVTVLGIVLLVVNDHLLKSAYPGLVTGKLSDFAGLLVAPPLLGALVSAVAPRLTGTPVACGALLVTGAGFTAAKSTTVGAAIASTSWSVFSGPSIILADHTDLIALPALGVAAWAWTRVTQRSATKRTPSRVGVLVVLPTAALAVVATSAPYYPDVVAATSWRNLLVIGQANAYLQDRSPEIWTVSTDGQSWRSMTDTEEADFEQELPALTTTAERSCVPSEPAHCYRIVRGHLRVEESTDGGTTWSVSWEIPDSRRGYLARSYPELNDIDTYLSSYALAVHPVPGGHVVLVANGRDGIALRDTAGSWTRTSAHGGDSAPLDARPSVLIPETIIAILVALLVVAASGWRLARRAGRTRLIIMFGLGGAVAVICGLRPWDGSPMAAVAVVMVAAGLCFALIAAIGLLATSPWRVVGRRRLFNVLMISVIVALGWWAPYIAWARGWTNYMGALLLGLAAVSAGLIFAHRVGQPVEPSPPTEPT
ncbi:hypothetical protein ACWDV4_29370 [Micromonospora sp. NPDC003197]